MPSAGAMSSAEPMCSRIFAPCGVPCAAVGVRDIQPERTVRTQYPAQLAENLGQPVNVLLRRVLKDEFDDNEQIRLRDFCHKIVQYKTNFILSNSDVKGKDENDNFFDEIYNEYHIQRVMATRMVNANPEKRGKLSELMISNISMNYR